MSVGTEPGRDGARQPEGRDPIWVFAYGSLMWRPGFRFAEARHARLVGYHRAFCIYSTHYRGTPSRPGLVLGLDRGGVCEGVAYRIDENIAGTLEYLRQRELIYGVYREALVPLALTGDPGQLVMGLAYVVERAHPSYAGRLSLAAEARVMRGAAGLSGTNLDYLANTVRHLAEAGIRERGLERLLALAGPHIAKGDTPALRASKATALQRTARQQPTPIRQIHAAELRRFLHRAKLSRA